MRVMWSTAAVAVIAVASPANAQQARNTVTNGDVVDMVRAGLSATLIVQSIGGAPSVIFDTSPRALIDLKASGVPEDVLKAMIARSGAAAPASATQTAVSVSPRPEPITSIEGGQSTPAGALSLPDGTVVHMKLLSNLSSATALVGDRPRLQVLDDVKVAGVVVIGRGAAGEGRVTAVKKGGVLGRSGSLDLVLVSVTAVDDSVVPLRLERSQSGQGRTATAVTSVAVDASTGGRRAAGSAAGELLSKGKEAVIPSNTEFTAFVDGSHSVTPRPARTR